MGSGSVEQDNIIFGGGVELIIYVDFVPVGLFVKGSISLSGAISPEIVGIKKRKPANFAVVHCADIAPDGPVRLSGEIDGKIMVIIECDLTVKYILLILDDNFNLYGVACATVTCQIGSNTVKFMP